MTAHEPTGQDEREALSAFISEYRHGADVAWEEDKRLADALIAVGWTRTPRPVTVNDEAVVAAHQAMLGRFIDDHAVRAGLEAALPHLSTGQSEADDRQLAREAMEHLAKADAERDRLREIDSKPLPDDGGQLLREPKLPGSENDTTDERKDR